VNPLGHVEARYAHPILAEYQAQAVEVGGRVEHEHGGIPQGVEHPVERSV
jgi:hypothetical protein